MRRVLLILLMFVIPYQFAWAGAASYCSHEGDALSKMHFGHHEHSHSVCKTDGKSSPAKKLVDDKDCGSCNLHASLSYVAHTALSVAMPHALEAALGPPVPKLSPPLSPPERPQWLRLA